MKFTNISVETSGGTFDFAPYDRGANGAFVYREAGASVHAPRLVVSTKADDNSSDKMTVQLNAPSVCPADDTCSVERLIGTDLVKTELRFLATTVKADRQAIIDKQIALLQELRSVIEERQVVYS